MTVSTSTNKAGPFAGAGLPGPFPVSFRFLSASHLRVVKTSTSGVDKVLAPTEYSVTGAGAQNGGTLTLAVPLLSGEKLTIVRDVPLTQEADYVNNDPFPAESHELALDKLTMIAQQLAEALLRALLLPPSVTGVSSQLPSPSADKLIGWDSTGTALRNVDPTVLASIVAYANRRTLIANGGQSSYTLDADPGNASNTLVAVGGVVQTPGVDYTVSGRILTPTPPWPAGTGNVAIVYGEALPIGVADAQNVLFRQGGSGAVDRDVEEKLREITITPADFGALGAPIGSTPPDETTALANFFTHLINNPGVVGLMPHRVYGVSAELPKINRSGVKVRGTGQSFIHNVGPIFSGTTIAWLGGAASGVIQRIEPDAGASNQVLSNVEYFGINVDCGARLSQGLIFRSVRSSLIGVGVANATDTGVTLGVLPAFTLGEQEDLQTNDIYLALRQVDGDGANGVPLRLQGSTRANISLNRFRMVEIIHANAIGIVEENADNNTWEMVRLFCTGAASYAVEWRGAGSEPVSCRGEVFFKLTANRPAVGRGTGTYAYPATNNVIFSLDLDNGTPIPVYETGATGVWQDSRGFCGGSPGGGVLSIGGVFAEGVGGLIAGRQRLGSTGSLHVVNGNADHMRVSDNSGANVWGINLDGSGNMRLLRLAGSGRYVDTLSCYTDAVDDAAAASAGVPVGARYRTGSVLKIRVS